MNKLSALTYETLSWIVAFIIALIVWAIVLIKQQINIDQYKNEMKQL